MVRKKSDFHGEGSGSQEFSGRGSQGGGPPQRPSGRGSPMGQQQYPQGGRGRAPGPGGSQQYSQGGRGGYYPREDSKKLTMVATNFEHKCFSTSSSQVLVNLTNDNPVGCQQIADFGGLDKMVSLLVNHFPSYDSGSPINGQLDDSSSSSQSTKTIPLNSKRLTGHALDFLVAILGLLVNIVDKDSRNRLRLASIHVLVDGPGASET